MSVTDAKDTIVRDLRNATSERDFADQAWRKAIQDAHADGLPVTEIAKEARCTRKTVYAIVSEKLSNSFKITNALHVLEGLALGPASDSMLQQAHATDDIQAKARRLLMIMKNVPPFQDILDSEARQLSDGAESAHYVLAHPNSPKAKAD